MSFQPSLVGPTSSLREKRELLTWGLGKLIEKVFDTEGYTCAADQLKRTEAEAAANAAKGSGIRRSLHLVGLAIDLNLYLGGHFLEASGDHKPFGDYWKTLHPLFRWGGDFKPKADGNHYSVEHEGVK